jgi:hypothetical protein
MLNGFDFCLPTRGIKVPGGPEWLHEIKMDGYRLRVERNGDRVRLITRGGYDWTRRFPWIVEAALKNKQKQFIIDGEAVILGVDGISDFDALHSGRHNDEVQLCAFDILAMGGDDLRHLPLSMRKANFFRLLARRPEGIFLSEFGQGEIGLIYSGRLARWALGAWSPNAVTGPTGWAVEALGQGQENCGMHSRNIPLRAAPRPRAKYRIASAWRNASRADQPGEASRRLLHPNAHAQLHNARASVSSK